MSRLTKTKAKSLDTAGVVRDVETSRYRSLRRDRPNCSTAGSPSCGHEFFGKLSRGQAVIRSFSRLQAALLNCLAMLTILLSGRSGRVPIEGPSPEGSESATSDQFRTVKNQPFAASRGDSEGFRRVETPRSIMLIRAYRAGRMYVRVDHALEAFDVAWPTCV